MNDIEKALKLLVENRYIVSAPMDKMIYLVDHGYGQPMTTRRTLQPKLNQFKKTCPQRVAVINLEELDWIDIEGKDFSKKKEG